MQPDPKRLFCVTCGGNVELVAGGPPPVCHGAPMVERKPYTKPVLHHLGSVRSLTRGATPHQSGR